MPQAETTGRFTVYMHRDAIEEVGEFASSQGYKSMADYARALIQRDMNEKGHPIDFKIDTWGRHSDAPPDGDKPKKKDKKKTE